MGPMTTPERDGIALTHLDEPLFDGAGAAKRDLVDYLDAVAGLIVPGLRDRPLSVIRVRAGQQPFMQKNVPELRAAVAADGDPVGRVVQARGPLRALQ